MNDKGTLFIVATPIGNLQDMTFRAVETLKNVDLILAEDTRHTGLLLHHYSITTLMLPFHEYNENMKISEVIQKLENGLSLALVSDAGTPLVSDPGFKLVRTCVEKGLKVESLPGPTAAITALTLSGLPSDKFLFIGFLPIKPGKRQKMLTNLRPFCHASDSEDNVKSTIILYESPHHLLRTLADIQVILGDIHIVTCRELTKIHQEVFHGTISESIEHFKHPKGEFVLLF